MPRSSNSSISGQSKPWQTGPREGHPWYHEKLSTQNTQHDPKEANAILDRIGYAKKDAGGFRLRPDGQKVFFAIDVIPTLFPDQPDALELIKRHWAAIGVDVKINTIERALFFTRGDSNEHDMQIWQGPGGLDPILDARDYLAAHPQGTRYAIPWALWYVSNGKDGQEPPEHQKKRLKLYDAIRATADLKKRTRDDEGTARHHGGRVRMLRDVPCDQPVRHRLEPASQCAGENAELLVVAASGSRHAAAVLYPGMIRRGDAGPFENRRPGAPRAWPSHLRECTWMLRFIVKRLLWMIPSLLVVSLLAFVLIQLPPGDFVTTHIATLAASNETVDQNMAAELRSRFGLDQPMIVQYLKWIYGIVTRGDFGLSFEWQQPVSELIWERMALTLLLTFSTLIMTWGIALPIGVFSAVKKYSIADYVLTFISFIGLAVPSFLLALVLMYVSAVHFGQEVGGLFSEQYKNAPWSLAKVGDLMNHLWIPVAILAVSGTASLIRIMRANMLDELGKPYVTTARAKGLSEFNGAGQISDAHRAQSLHLDHCVASAQSRVGIDRRCHRAEPADCRAAFAAVADEPGHVSRWRFRVADLRAHFDRLAA